MWTQVVVKNPSKFHYNSTPFEMMPVEEVSWNDCQKFCLCLSRKLGVKVSLPTEAQWEYTCRAGTETPFSHGDTLYGDWANCNGTKPYGTTMTGRNFQKPILVSSFYPNPWGLRNMHGNVWEWCADWYDSHYYENSPTHDPKG